jgi:hypothetical protein
MSIYGPPSSWWWRFLSIVLISFLQLELKVSAQILGYESFMLPVQSGLTGAGTGDTGWTDSGWSGGTDARFQVIAPVPNLTYQLTGGPLIDGASGAVQVTTNPEPVPGNGLVASRSITPQNTTLYVSFLVRPVAVGTGSDAIEVQLNSGSTTWARIALMPDQGQQFLQVQFRASNVEGNTTIGKVYPGQTYLVVARASRPYSYQLKLEGVVNPTATIPATFANTYSYTGGTIPDFDTVALKVISTDTGGPTTTAIVDELKVGYTWNDVVPQSPQSLVPTVTINNAVNLQWQTQTGHTYQPQYSFDLSTWFNLGSAITGDGTIKSLFDSSTSQAKKFYQVQIH